LTEILTLHRCKHCGYLLDDTSRKYHSDCAVIAERVLNNDAQARYREKHGNGIVTRWHKEHPEKRKKHTHNYTKKHRQAIVEYNSDYRKTHPAWYRDQLQKNNEKLHERRHTRGNCPKCGKEANKSSQLGLCTLCLFKRSDEKYRKRTDYSVINKQLLRKEFEHLVPDQLYNPWVDEFIYIINSKVRLGLIAKTGEKRVWRQKEIQRVWDAHREQQHEYQTMHFF